MNIFFRFACRLGRVGWLSSVALAVVALSCEPAHAQLSNTTWQGASGASWSTTGNWSGGVTTGTTRHFVINNSLGGGSPVVLNTSPSIGGLTIASGFTLTRGAADASSRTLTISGSTATDTVFNNAGTISSGGTGGNVVIIINTSAGTISNSGTMEATAGTGLLLRSNATNNAYTITNTGGVLRTVGSGTLSFADTNGPVSVTGGSISNAAGTISHRRTTTLTDVTFTNGGIFTSDAPTSAAGTQYNIVLAGASSLSNTGTMSFTKDVSGTSPSQSQSLQITGSTASLTNSGSMYFAMIGTATSGFAQFTSLLVAVSSTVTNNGVMTFESRSDTNATSFNVNAALVSLAGTGTLTLAVGTGGAASQARISGGSGSELVNGVSHTIRGAGAFGNLGLEKFTNNGTLNADAATALTVALRSGTAGVFTNSTTGTVRASGAGGIVFSSSNQFTNQGLVQVDGGSVLALGPAIFSTPGQLKVNGSLTANGPISVAGTLSGTGAVSPSVTVSGILAPGNSIGTISMASNLTLTGTSQYELGTPGASTVAPGNSDLTAVSGTLTLGGNLQLIDNAGANGLGSAAGGVYRLFTYGSLSGSFASVTANPTPTTRTSLSNISYGGSGTAAGNGVFLSVYNLAAAGISSGTSLNLGTVLKNTSLSQALTISNTAPTGSYSEKLDATFGSLTGNATNNGGSISLLTAGGTSTAMSVGLSSATAGNKSGSAQIGFTSNGDGTSGLGTASLGSQTVNLTATVLDPAVASFASGSTATTLTLNFGSVNEGASVSPLGFSLYNLMQTAGFTADLALVDIAQSNPSGPLSTNLTTFNSLASGSFNSWLASVDTSSQGPFTNTWTLTFKSSNGGTVYTADTPQTLTLTANVIVVPEPGAIALGGIGIATAACAYRQRRRRRTRRALAEAR